MAEVTQLLQQVSQGNELAHGQLLEVVYTELRRLAAAQMAREKPGQTLQATALVHEAWLRLVKQPVRSSDPQERPSPPGRLLGAGRSYFFAAAAEAMRRILVEQARRKLAVKHGGGVGRKNVEVDQLPQSTQQEQDEVLAVHEALDRLGEHDPIKAELVKLRYFAGLTNDEAAELLGITPKSAEKQWVYARAWLKHKLTT